jgi:hypothetical protein
LRNFIDRNISNLTFNFLVIKNLAYFIVFILIGGTFIFAQDKISYDIDASIVDSEKKIKIRQKMVFKKPSPKSGDTLYLTDWSNAYSSTKTPLAQRFVEEYNRSFYLSNKLKLGKTSINMIIINGSEAKWERLKNQPDIIKVIYDSKNNTNHSLTLALDYQVAIPDAKFTGYGYNAKGDILLRNWYIALSPIYDSHWKNYSHLNLDDFSIQAAEYSLKLSVPEGTTVQTNLQKNKVEDGVHYFSSQHSRDVSLYFSKDNPFQTFKTAEDRFILTDVFKKSENKEVNFTKVKRIDEFISNVFDFKGKDKYLVPALIYDKNPFFGLIDLPEFLAPFNDFFLDELSFLKSYLHIYLSNNLPIDLRQDHWIVGGLQTYLIIKYIETYYPSEKYLGRVGDFWLMKAYTLADIDFNESFWMYYEFMERANLHQSDFLSKDQLVKFNEKIGSPYHVGIGLRYIEHYIGIEALNRGLKEYLNQPSKSLGFLDLIKKYSLKNIDWFEKFYLKERLPIDLKIKNLKKYNDSIEVKLSRHSDDKIPFVISQIKNDSIIDQMWIDNMGTDYSIKLKDLKPDFVAINPKIRLPESNKNNNWRYAKNFLNFKPLQFNFLRDYESPKRNQIFYNPVVNYNLYDGLSLGSRFYDKGFLTQKFTFELMPQYSSLQKNLVGKAKIFYRINNVGKSNYVTTLSFYGSSYHYTEDLRYQVITPGINLYFRTDDFRSNKQNIIGLYYYSVKRDSPPDPITNPNYELYNLRYVYSNRGALKHTTFETGIEYSNKFTKVQMTFDYRRLLSSGSQISARVFAGKFLTHNQREISFFDFNLNRPQDYLFRYSYFGRSENDGFFSQQIVMAEGGFKSLLFPNTANEYLLTTNLTMGIWKWIEAYVDLGILKNRNHNPHFLHGSGIRLNILPDYLEIFLPLHTNKGWEFNENHYGTKIRFILLFSPKQLSKLFSRRWF